MQAIRGRETSGYAAPPRPESWLAHDSCDAHDEFWPTLDTSAVRAEHIRYFERCNEVLRERFAPDERFTALRDAFRYLPEGAGALPCPYCFASRRNEQLSTLTFTGSVHALWCRRCYSTLLVATGI